VIEFNKHYFTKEQLKYRIPSTLNLSTFWDELVEERKKTLTEVPLADQNGHYFWFNVTEKIAENINSIDKIATRDILEHVPSEISASVILDSLIDEAYYSSVIEGAFSTKRRTEELVNNKLEPENKSERMILNNYFALSYILENLSSPINEETILNIYTILTKDTLEADDIVEKYRNDFVGVWDQKKLCYTYEAPHHTKVQELMDSLIDFINNNDTFPPLIKACIIHFYFVYIHPFFDGNGRTARAISYMYLLKQGYDFLKFFSISSLIQEERRKYYESIENTENYESDLTYFIDYYLSMITKSLNRVLEKFKKEFGKKIIKTLLQRTGIILNIRQNKIINHYISIDKNTLSIEEYKKKYKISYETARTDLQELATLGFFQKRKVGKKFIFIFNKLEDIIQNFESSKIDS